MFYEVCKKHKYDANVVSDLRFFDLFSSCVRCYIRILGECLTGDGMCVLVMMDI